MSAGKASQAGSMAAWVTPPILPTYEFRVLRHARDRLPLLPTPGPALGPDCRPLDPDRRHERPQDGSMT